jgi:plasmid segregation protein ParM
MGGYAALDEHLDEPANEVIAAIGALKPPSSGEALDDLSVLMIDPGEHTLDWLLIQAQHHPRRQRARRLMPGATVVRSALESRWWPKSVGCQPHASR